LTIPREDTVVLYRTSHSFLFFSNLEYSPIVLYEAAAAGCSILATPAGNSEEILLLTKAGTIVPSRVRKQGFVTVKTWPTIRILRRLHRINRLQNKPLVNNQRTNLMQYSWQELAKKYLNLFEDLRQQKSHSR
jgi:glycosyltransferase involved in cell wall biosynthesis